MIPPLRLALSNPAGPPVHWTNWACRHRASDEEVQLLRALADSTSVAMENIDVYRTLEERIAARTAELEASRTELARKHEALVEVQRQKEEMAALLAHDLKSPASGILLACKARLRSRELPEGDRKAWRSIEASADVINRLALDLVDLARSADGAFSLRPSEVDLGALLAELVERMTPLAEAREQRLVLNTDFDDGGLTADRELLMRVLQNLVDNALRHSRGAAVWLSAQDLTDRVHIRVIDEGPGIPEEMRRQVFEKYTRLGVDDAGRTAGHGLGLAFCRLAIEAHGGRITIEPNRPNGAVFVIELPRRPAAAALSSAG